MKKYQYILLSLLTGFLLCAGWPARGFPLILLIAFIPLLFAEEQLNKIEGKKQALFKFFLFYLAFLVWNILTTWWVSNATLFGGVFAIVFYSLFMTIVFMLFSLTKRKTGKTLGYISLIFYWLAFEYLHLNWELSWSWLNLGNGFANYPKLIQWYEYTGTFGGTLWILVINILLFLLLSPQSAIQSPQSKFQSSKYMFLLISLILALTVPIFSSLIMYFNYKESGEKINVVAVQPNIDPYNEKFGGLSLDVQLSKMLNLAKAKATKNTNLIVFPETAISDGIWENKLEGDSSIERIKNLTKQFPKAKILIGMSSFKFYAKGDKKPESARKFTHEDNWYDAFNTALLIDTSNNIQLYHKSKLVPGVERMPYPGIFKFLDKYSINMGGMTGSLGTQNDRTPLGIANYKLGISNNKNIIIAPSICYESVYGDFMRRYSKNGANLICIITNDGWWKDTPGYKQHFQYARLRAIETRRSVVRSANTGTSGFINQRGDILMSTPWWKPLAIEDKVNLNSRKTLYVLYGDYIGKIGLIISFLILGYTLLKK